MEHFETPESLKRKRCGSWVAMPNKQDGRGYKRIMAEPDGSSIYGTWCAVVQVASKMPVRGLLADLDGPLSPDDIATKISATTKEVERMIAVVSEPARIDWIEAVEWDEDASFEENVAALTKNRQIPDFPFMRDGNPSDMKRNRQAKRTSARPGQDGSQPIEDSPTCGKSVRRDGNPSGMTGNRVHNSTGQNITNNPPTVPQGGQILPDSMDFSTAKAFLHDLFGREKRHWSQEEDQLLSEHVPLLRQDAELIDEWFRLPLDHPVFQQTKAKHELTTFLRDFNGELDKMRRYRPLFAEEKNNARKPDPPRWRDFFHWKYGTDIRLPETFDELENDQRREYKRDFQTFENQNQNTAAMPA
jgi:hypothetical protein